MQNCLSGSLVETISPLFLTVHAKWAFREGYRGSSHYHSTNDSECEVDFALQTEKRVIPVEVKAEENVKAKSLKTYIDAHPNLKGLRVSMLNYIDQGWMENLPLYAIEGYLRAEGIPVPDSQE